MIYLIETTYYNKDTKEVLDLLKIGYTEDSKKDKRFMAYRMHSPGYYNFEIIERKKIREYELLKRK